jgi:carbon storage regulator CsrA
MLVLSRNVGQEVVINRNCRIKILEFNGSQVRLGFDCPPDVPILRGELTPFEKKEGDGDADSRA